MWLTLFDTISSAMKLYNKRLGREYSPLEKYEAGIVLLGAEVKAVKQGRIRIDGAYVKLIGNEVHLVGAEIAIYQYARPDRYDPQRTRKLLLHKKEVLRLATKLAGGGNLTIVPASCYNKGGLIKVEIALARGKKTWEVKRVEKERDERRRVEGEIKERIKN